jgi:hypothetical protein
VQVRSERRILEQAAEELLKGNESGYTSLMAQVDQVRSSRNQNKIHLPQKPKQNFETGGVGFCA